MSLLAALAAVVFAFFACLLENPQGLSHGPVSRSHAQLACSDCHGENISLPTSTRAAWASVDSTQETNRKCNACHFASQNSHLGNATHHLEATLADISQSASCVDCHREHQGHSVSLSSVSDEACLRCHARLETICASNVTDVWNYVHNELDREPLVGFQNHPDFRAVVNATDPGVLRFNHALHLRAGVSDARLRREKAWKVNRNAAIEERYRAEAQTNLIKLDCGDCHEPSADGALMKPISYERHCQLCHPLNINLESDSDVVGHGLERDAVESQVYGYFAMREAHAGSPLMSERASFARPGLPSERYSTAPWESLEEVVRGSARRTIERLYEDSDIKANSCHFCHNPDSGNAFNVELMSPPDPRYPNKIVPDSWFRRSRFDHRSHRFWTCEQCHTETGKADANSSTKVLIPGIKVCRQCHKSKSNTAAATSPFVASSSCTKCHDYHALP